MTRWGEAVLARLDLAGDERVLDAGCGTGQVTALLRERLPRGQVIALDGSAAMLGAAERRLGTERTTYLLADLTQPICLDEPVDAILSTATFHWIEDHDAMFRNLAAALKPRGRLVAQCGGSGNVASIEAAIADVTGQPRASSTHFASPDEMRASLEAAGFIGIDLRLQDEPTPLPDQDLEPYLEAICLGDIVEPMEEQERAAFVHEIARRLPRSEIDYVRLNIDAELGAS
jgi:trans-aconitate 2-methyltransferase